MATCGRCKKFKGEAGEVKRHWVSGVCADKDPWSKVLEAQQKGDYKLARYRKRRVLGLKRKPMTEDARERFRQSQEEKTS